MQELFDLVRESAERSAWTRGVELARSGAVLAEPGADDERVVRVRGGGVVHPTVILYPEDEDGTEAEYRLVGPDESDAAQRRISIESPLGRALMGKLEDDEVQWVRPRGTTRLVILAIRYETKTSEP